MNESVSLRHVTSLWLVSEPIFPLPTLRQQILQKTMARRYDSSTTMFSPEGRLHQVEYAMEAINNAGTCVGLLADNGIVLAAEKKVTSGLLQPAKRSEKTYAVARHVACTVAGLTADAQLLTEEARWQAAIYKYEYQTEIPVLRLTEHVCNTKQYYTQRGGLRPFGVAFLLAGYDSQQGFQLYQTDPSGNYSGWKATVIGANNQAGKSLLKNEYFNEQKEEELQLPTVDAALRLAVRVLHKTMDGTGASAVEKIELFTLRKDENGDIVHHILTADETQEVLDAVEQEAASAGDS